MKTCLLIALFLLAGVAGRVWWHLRPNSAEQMNLEATTSSSSSPIIAADDSAEKKDRIREEVVQLLVSRDYRALNLFAAELRASKETYARGDLPITFYFSCFGDLPEGSTATDWESHLQSLREWFTEDSDSIVPRVALAQGLLNYAWQARGHSFAPKVTEDGWRLFTERLTEARRILIAAGEMEGKCPVFFATRLRLALVDGTSREQYDRLFEEAVSAFPNYPGFAMIRTNYLLPRWHGEAGDWEAFTAAYADRIGGEEGDIAYAQIVWHIHEKRNYKNIFEDTKVEWSRTQRGLEALCRRYPASLSALSEYCRISGSAGARDVTKGLFVRLGNRVDLSVWDTIETWTQARSWAFYSQ